MQREAGSVSGRWHRHLQQSHLAEVKLGWFPSQVCGAAVVLLAHPTRRRMPPPRGRNDPRAEGEAAMFEVALVAEEFAL